MGARSVDPPEFMLLPNWFYLNIYKMSSWTRGIVIPMAILSSLRPIGACRSRARVDELFKDPARETAAFDWSKQLISGKTFSWRWIADLKLYEKLPGSRLRRRALREAKVLDAESHRTEPKDWPQSIRR